MNKPRWKDGDDHPSADLLLLNLEGELEPKEAAAIEEHMKHCWACRARCSNSASLQGRSKLSNPLSNGLFERSLVRKYSANVIAMESAMA